MGFVPTLELAEIRRWWDRLSPQWEFLSQLGILNSLRQRQNGRYNADDIFKCIFVNENVWFPTKISLKFVPKGPINNIPALVLIMAWRRPGDKPLSEPMMVSLLTHICVTRPQWVKVLEQHLDIEWGSRYDMCENLPPKKTYSESIFESWFLFWNGAVYLQVSLLVHTFLSNFLGTFWWASLKSYWSCWSVLWHKPVLIIESMSYFFGQNIILAALNFENRI